MKKIAKLSLVAAIAVSGLTAANATPLEEAIKGVDVSGTVVYRYDDRTTDNATADGFSNESNNSYKVALNLKSSINDDLTFNARTIIGDSTGMAEVGDSTTGADGEATFGLSHANFAYTGIMNTTVIAGKQAVPSPFAVQADAAGNENTGTGITSLTTVGPVTVAATYLNQTNLFGSTTGQDIAGLGLMGDLGPVALDGWYLQALESNSANDDGASLYTLGAKAKVEMVELTSRYSAIDPSASGMDTESIAKVGAKAKFGIVTASVDYGQSNDSDSYASLIGLAHSATTSPDADADVNLQAWALNLNKNDAQLIKATLGVDVLANVNLSATYADLSVDSAANSDASEYYGQLTYKMGKNFMTYARIGQVEYDVASGVASKDNTRGRLHVQYTF
ncbi:Campylo_MOMP domain-containing protein [Arcobacter acticola]|uniref:Campylo_MOMP domain-containing protein n=1 Tax=Arcobacter acticola TaxID=1849015 RepID=A0A6M8EYX9_9BACT|nr:porin [Arcobacter acticola]QKE29757.1 Campylo_MOMP domain-containing protein [Arcobacter acticola]